MYKVFLQRAFLRNFLCMLRITVFVHKVVPFRRKKFFFRNMQKIIHEAQPDHAVQIAKESFVLWMLEMGSADKQLMIGIVATATGCCCGSTFSRL